MSEAAWLLNLAPPVPFALIVNRSSVVGASRLQRMGDPSGDQDGFSSFPGARSAER